MKSPYLIGERIYFRALEREDAALCRDFVNDPDVWRTLDQHRPKNLSFEEEWIAGQCRNEHTITFGITLKQNDRLIGVTALDRIDAVHRKAGFGLTIGAKDEWHKGYGTEATQLMLKYGFMTLNLNRIVLNVYSTNPFALRAYKKAGFILEGTLRQDMFREGKYIDVFRMGILREEWERLTQKSFECTGLTDA